MSKISSSYSICPDLLPLLSTASTTFVKKTFVNGRSLSMAAIIAETIAKVTRAYDQTSIFEDEEEKRRLETERKAEEARLEKIESERLGVSKIDHSKLAKIESIDLPAGNAKVASKDVKSITTILNEAKLDPAALIAGLGRFSEVNHPGVSSTDADVAMLRADGCFELVFDILLDNLSNVDVLMAALNASMGCVCKREDGKKVAEHPSTLKGVTGALKAYSSHVDVVRCALRTIERIAYAYSGKLIPESGVMEEIVAAVKNYTASIATTGDIAVCKFGIQAMKNLASMYPYPLGEKGALGATIAAMKAYPDDKEVYAAGCALIMVSCWNGHHDNKARIEAAGGFPFIVELLKKPAVVSDEQTGSSVICDALNRICGTTNVSYPISGVDPAGYDKFNPMHAKTFGGLGACEAAFALLAKNRFPNWYTHLFLETLAGLALCEDNRVELVSLGIFPLLKSILESINPEKHRSEIVSNACDLTRRLFYRNLEAQKASYEMGGCGTLLIALKLELAFTEKNPKYYRNNGAIFDSVICMSGLSEECSAELGASNILETAVQIMKLTPDSAELYLNCCQMIISLVKNVQNKLKLFDLPDLLPLLSTASTTFVKKTFVNGRSLSMAAIIAETIAKVTRAYDQTSIFEDEEEKRRLETERKAEEARLEKIESERLAEIEDEKKRVAHTPKKGIIDKFKEFKEAEERRLAAEEAANKRQLEVQAEVQAESSTSLNHIAPENTEGLSLTKIESDRLAEIEDEKKRVAHTPKKGIMDKFKEFKEAEERRLAAEEAANKRQLEVQAEVQAESSTSLNHIAPENTEGLSLTKIESDRLAEIEDEKKRVAHTPKKGIMDKFKEFKEAEERRLAAEEAANKRQLEVQTDSASISNVDDPVLEEIGNRSSGVCKEVAISSEAVRTILIGLDGAGKTTLLYKLKLGKEICVTIPTIGFNVETFKTQTVWDLGGAKAIRPLWHHYFNQVASSQFLYH
jgi:hypothetical protein